MALRCGAWSNQRRVPDQVGDAGLGSADGETRFTNKSTDRDAPGDLSRLAMRARTSRRVKGSTGYSERGSIRLDCLRPEETFRCVFTPGFYDRVGRVARIHHGSDHGRSNRIRVDRLRFARVLGSLACIRRPPARRRAAARRSFPARVRLHVGWRPPGVHVASLPSSSSFGGRARHGRPETAR